MKFLDVNQHLSELDEHIKVLKSYGDVFEAVEARITRVINMDGAFKGEGAKGVIYNHTHMQLPTIRSIRAFLISFSDTLEKMKANITEYEPASNGSVSENFWKNQLPKAYDRYEETLEEREATINQATAQVSHILHLGKLQTGDLYNSVDSARKHADTVLEGLYDLDQAGVELMAQVRTKMEELKATIRQVLDWNMTGGVTMKGVSIMEIGGYFANNATLHEKAPEVKVELLDLNPLVQYANDFPLRFKYDTMHSINESI
ncbi:transposase (12) [Halalkalibacterium halodurans C-125]|uniref:Transposase (12) n=1 Tax=Halalkalibacterium halodurans (strain ATCC BAA-125 / DSM 18197 / FERM 7344 / JCM 9153 / C-125) TaxID=272558 RepID=Q9K5U6_HALH5|nr:T7SS effector LXG polymorphic toxin [Halalkalibacterium halodurans]BAB07711.1 transposase (12) [Halalkalibacterium halodurans C-125]